MLVTPGMANAKRCTAVWFLSPRSLTATAATASIPDVRADSPATLNDFFATTANGPRRGLSSTMNFLGRLAGPMSGGRSYATSLISAISAICTVGISRCRWCLVLHSFAITVIAKSWDLATMVEQCWMHLSGGRRIVIPKAVITCCVHGISLDECGSNPRFMMKRGDNLAIAEQKCFIKTVCGNKKNFYRPAYNNYHNIDELCD